MSRKEKIFALLKDRCQAFLKEDLAYRDRLGVSAEEISNALGMLRSNASKTLNELVRESRAIKITGRPVLFFERSILEKIVGRKLAPGEFTVTGLGDLDWRRKDKKTDSSYRAPSASTYSQSITAFNQIVGSEGSLRPQIKQAKAAILYPPYGLHTLITGPTGVGKSLLAKVIHEFGVESGCLNENAPFITFNCADYSNNPQLLFSQLFGHAKGAYSGAEVNKVGLVEQANGGILFLDEVHRLPPDGQEMLFRLMDYGKFYRLGETGLERQAQVRIIAATTQDPSSVLLQTFMRRIPLTIHLPALEKRPLGEKMELIRLFFSEESTKIGMSINVSADVVKALLMYECPGNIGQLRSDIQLMCARAFADYNTSSKKELQIDSEFVSGPVKRALLDTYRRRGLLGQVVDQGGEYVSFSPSHRKRLRTTTVSAPTGTIYEDIIDRIKDLQAASLPESRISALLEEDIRAHFSKFLDKVAENEKNKRRRFAEVVSSKVMKVTETLVEIAEEMAGEILDERLFYALAMHLGTSIERLRTGDPIVNPELESIKRKYPEDFAISKRIVDIVSKEFEISFPDDEAAFITLLLNSVRIKDKNNSPRVGVLVVCHGEGTATGMVKVAQELLDINHGKGIDMSLDESPQVMLRRILEIARRLDEGKGILMLVDMGSLTTFGDIISERIGIQVETVDMVSTPMVIEAIRRSVLPDVDLSTVARAVRDISPFVGRLVDKRPEKPVVVVSCLTGRGTAKKLKEQLEIDLDLSKVSIRTMSAADREKMQDQLLSLKGDNGRVVVVVGSVDPSLEGVPFIPLEDLYAGSGMERIRSIVYGNTTWQLDVDDITRQGLVDVTTKVLSDFLEDGEAKKTIPEALRIVDLMQERLGYKFSSNIVLRLIVHIACMVDRLRKGDDMRHPREGEVSGEYPLEYRTVKELLVPFFRELKLEITEGEIAFVIDMLIESKE